ncbi:MAG: glycosyltransferase family 4 protein [Pseudomonadota bacterium]
MSEAGGDPRPLTLCVTSLDGARGGVAASNACLRAAMAALARRRGAALEILSLHDAPEDAARLAPGAAVRAFRGATLRFALAALRAAPRARMMAFDHAHLAAPLLALAPSRRPRIAVIGHGSEVGRALRRRSAASLAAADIVLTNSDHTLRAMRAALGAALSPERAARIGRACPLGLPPHSAATAYPPSEAESAAARSGLSLRAADGADRPIGARMLLLVGRMDAGEGEKGQAEMIDAMPSLLAAHPGAQLVLAGGGSDEARLRADAAASDAAGALFLTGRAPRPMLERLYQAAHAFAMPSRQEGFGLVFLEAMNRAKPCLACRGDGGAEVVVDGETGVLIDQPVRREALVAALSQLLADPARAARLGAAGWRRLQERFSAAAHRARLMEHLGPLLDGAPAPAAAPRAPAFAAAQESRG